jgi:hypothetical protein
MEEEQEFKDSYSDRERVHYSNKLGDMIPNYILSLSGNDKYKKLTKTERFLISCDAIARNLSEQFDNKILTEDDITEILTKTETLNVEYKNPCAFVLGFIVYKNLLIQNKDKDKDKYKDRYKKILKYVIKNFLDTANYMGSNQNSWGVTAPDIIRYTNLWNKS